MFYKLRLHPPRVTALGVCFTPKTSREMYAYFYSSQTDKYTVQVKSRLTVQRTKRKTLERN